MKLCSNVVSWRVTVAAGFAMALKINDGFMQMCQQQSGCDTFIFHLLSLLFFALFHTLFIFGKEWKKEKSRLVNDVVTKFDFGWARSFNNTEYSPSHFPHSTIIVQKKRFYGILQMLIYSYQMDRPRT